MYERGTSIDKEKETMYDLRWKSIRYEVMNMIYIKNNRFYELYNAWLQDETFLYQIPAWTINLSVER